MYNVWSASNQTYTHTQTHAQHIIHRAHKESMPAKKDNFHSIEMASSRMRLFLLCAKAAAGVRSPHFPLPFVPIRQSDRRTSIHIIDGIQITNSTIKIVFAFGTFRWALGRINCFQRRRRRSVKDGTVKSGNDVGATYEIGVAPNFTMNKFGLIWAVVVSWMSARLLSTFWLRRQIKFVARFLCSNFSEQLFLFSNGFHLTSL